MQQPGPCQRAQFAAQRLGCGDQEVSQLAEAGALGVDRAFACGHQCLQRLAFTAGPGCRGPLAGQHTAGGADSVERVGLATRAALPPQPADLEHPLTAAAQEAREAGTERGGALDSERSPTRCVPVDELQRVRIAVTARGNRLLEDDRAADDVHDRERMRVTVRVDTDHVVQLICKHHFYLQPRLGDTLRCRSGR